MIDLNTRVFSILKRLHLPVKPWLYSVKAMRVLQHLPSWYRRCKLAGDVTAGSPWKGFVAKSKGYALLSSDTIPETRELVIACQNIVKNICLPDDSKKTFFSNILNPEDLNKYPQLLHFALSRAFIEIGTDYLGMIPVLRAMGLFISEPNNTIKSSQMFHFDGDDFHQLKCFINIVDVDERAGPFCFLPADVSENVRVHVGHKWGDGRIEDSDVFKYCSEHDLVRTTGPEGTGAIVDTTNCLHFGSRSRGVRRIVFMFQYTGFPDIKIDKRKVNKTGMPLMDFSVYQNQGDPLTQFVLER